MSAIPPTLCPVCGYGMDRATGAMSDESVPREGDIAICMSCGAALIYDADIRPTREATPEEIDRIDGQAGMHLLAAQILIRKRGPLTDRSVKA